ncbi:MAG: hypothetical protein WDA27_04875 [Actinomycetota bacterium]
MPRLMVVSGLLLALMFGCSSKPTPQAESSAANTLPQGSQAVELDPADFVGAINHTYWPMKPGSTWVYREIADDGTAQRVEITVMSETKNILGIKATVVHDVVTEEDAVIEDTLDWYAQDRVGNLWYLGEDTKEYENGKVVSTAGSWEAGQNGAQAGIILPARPRVGMTYRQEYLKGQAEDAASVLSLDELAEVPHGSFSDVLLTKDYTTLEPNLLEYKFYAKGIGPVLVLAVSGGSGREELVSFKAG